MSTESLQSQQWHVVKQIYQGLKDTLAIVGRQTDQIASLQRQTSLIASHLNESFGSSATGQAPMELPPDLAKIQAEIAELERLANL
jgi:hypothetical protein